MLAASFGDNGQLIDQLGKSYTLTVKGETYNKILTDGFVYDFTFPVKKAGGYQYRVAIRDAGDGKIGSASQYVDVPDLKKNKVTASSIVLENMSEADFQKVMDPAVAIQRTRTTALSDTAQRRVKRGTVLRYGYEITTRI